MASTVLRTRLSNTSFSSPASRRTGKGSGTSSTDELHGLADVLPHDVGKSVHGRVQVHDCGHAVPALGLGQHLPPKPGSLLVLSGRAALLPIEGGFGEGNERPVRRHVVPDCRLLMRHAAEHPVQVAERGLAQAVILDHRPHVLEMDAGRAQQPEQGALHHGAPMGDAFLLAELDQAAHERQARQAGGRGAQAAALLGQREAGDFRRVRKGQGGKPLRRADGLHREAVGPLGSARQDQAGRADNSAAGGEAEHDVAGVGVVGVGFQAALVRLVAAFQAINLMAQLVSVTDQGRGVGHLDDQLRGGSGNGLGQGCLGHGAMPAVGLRVSRFCEVSSPDF